MNIFLNNKLNIFQSMKFWNYISEFFLFRWLFGSHKRNEPKRDVSDTNISHADRDFANDIDSYIGCRRHSDNSYSRYDNQDYSYSQSYDDFLDEQDDYDMMDDDF